VQLLDEISLADFLEFNGRHLVAVDRAGTMVGYLLSFSSGSDYDDSEFCDLRHRVAEPFFYICQVVVAPEHRGRRIGSALYEALAETARHQGARLLCCDVNTNPPNPDSFAFHRRLGFFEIGEGTASNGFAIAFLARRL
jgi:predicted GNAT superfamily acetyltransferase